MSALRITPRNITTLADYEIFTFGSNEQGKHGSGAAKTAMQWGAKWGIGYGLQGNTFAIPTREYLGLRNIRTLPLEKIKFYVDKYLKDVLLYPDKIFLTTMIGCGYAGLTPEQVAPLFKDAVNIENVFLPKEFLDIIQRQA